MAKPGKVQKTLTGEKYVEPNEEEGAKGEGEEAAKEAPPATGKKRKAQASLLSMWANKKTTQA